jgi:Rho termination factor, N-terminal domain
MFNWVNPINTALRPIDGLYHIRQFAAPSLKAVWQALTTERTQRILRALSLAVLVLGTIVLCGMFELGRLAVREAGITFRAQLATTIAESVAEATTGGGEAEAEALIPRQTGVRQLRRVATQRGIRNAGRMRKPELLAVLQLI